VIKLSIETAQVAWAVSVDDLKTHLRVTILDDNAYITGLGKAAQAKIEDYTNRRLNAITYDMYMNDFPSIGIVLPYSPVSAVSSVKYYDGDNTLQTWSTDEYEYDIIGEPGVISPKDGYSFPETYNKLNAVVVQFVTGYTSIPDEFVEAIKLLVYDMYDNRMDKPREKFTAWQSLIYSRKIFS